MTGGLKILTDTRLSWKAKGMFLFLALKFHGEFSFPEMRKKITSSSLALYITLHGLLSTGYIKKMGKVYLVPQEYWLD